MRPMHIAAVIKIIVGLGMIVMVALMFMVTLGII